MNSLKLLTFAAIASGLVAGSPAGQGGPMTAPLADGAVEIIEIRHLPEVSAGLAVALAGRLVVASADSGYRPSGTGGGLRREL
jgi:hypothetical protein